MVHITEFTGYYDKKGKPINNGDTIANEYGIQARIEHVKRGYVAFPYNVRWWQGHIWNGRPIWFPDRNNGFKDTEVVIPNEENDWILL